MQVRISPLNINNNIHKQSFKSRYFDGEFYNDQQEEMAKRIAKYKIAEWPQGLNSQNRYLYGVDDGIFLDNYPKPKTDYEFQELLLKQEVVIPSKPPEYCRNYDKLFNTQKWKDFQTWPEYEEKTTLFQKIKKLIDFLRVENIKLEKFKKEEATKKILQSAFVKSQLMKEFLSFFNSEDKGKAASIPNAIMIEGPDIKENEENIKWLVSRTNANYVKIKKDPKISNEDYLATIDTLLDEAKTNYKNSNKRTLLFVEDFEKLILNGTSTGDIKETLTTLSDEYKTTLLFSTTNSKKLDPISLQDHRVGIKIKIKDKISADDFIKLQLDFLRANIKKINKTDGYRFNYLPGEAKNVDLYLGCFGTNDKILWLEHKNAQDIEYAVKFIDAIKKIKCFRNIEKIQCTAPSDMSKAKELGFEILSSLTKEMKTIIEKRL